MSNITLGDFLGSSGRNVSPLPPRVDNTAGQATFGAFTYGNAPGASGGGILATITLIPQANGESVLSLQNPQMTDTAARLIPVTVTDGRAIVSQCPKYDVDCDGDVDITDIMAVASHWGCHQGDACYDPRYDMDNDGDIDIVDIMAVTAHWGCKRGDACYGPGVHASASLLHIGEGDVRLGPPRPTRDPQIWRIPVYLPSPTVLDGIEIAVHIQGTGAKVMGAAPGDLLQNAEKGVLVLPVRWDESTSVAHIGVVTYGPGQPVQGQGHLLNILVRSAGRPQVEVRTARVLHFAD